jgi:hypothetical protein
MYFIFVAGEGLSAGWRMIRFVVLNNEKALASDESEIDYRNGF